MPREEPRRECRRCVHFRDDPAMIEALVTGLASFGSGYSSVRADDGLCLHHQRYLSGRASCPDFDAG